jgi:hypothetical protein
MAKNAKAEIAGYFRKLKFVFQAWHEEGVVIDFEF